MEIRTRHHELLLRHVICLDDSRPSELLDTKPEKQMAAIFSTYLPEFIDRQRAAGKEGKIPVLFWAHGGLVGRESGIHEAAKAIPWWLANGIYPIFFVWDTGLGPTILDVAWGWNERRYARQKQSAAPGPAPAVTARDRRLDAVADNLGAAEDWNQMKKAAREASAQGGGAHLLVNRLSDNWDGLDGNVSLHAIGHSAGCIFHAYFIRALIEAKFAVETLQLLAPAITIGDFTNLVQAKIGDGIGDVRMFALTKKAERADHLLGIYQDGSLLYFIRNALESSPNVGILGLQESYARYKPTLLKDRNVVWAPHRGGPRTSSEAKTHTAFPTDRRTLHSLACNILDRDNLKAIHGSRGWLGWLRGKSLIYRASPWICLVLIVFVGIRRRTARG